MRARRWAASRFGFGMLVAQLLPAMAVLTGRYRILAGWDSFWYRSIVDHGYVSTIPPVAQRWDEANVAFFPAYPLAGYLVKSLLRVDTMVALLIVSHLSCWAFWVYFHKIFARLKFTANETLTAAALFALVPGAFFLITGYSEPLFLATAAGYLYWCARGLERPSHFALAAAHGVVLTGTRYFGAVIAVLPLVPLLLAPPKPSGRIREAARGVALFALSLGGMLAFFCYCQVKFGAWNLYFQTVAIGWSGHFSFGHLWANLTDPALYLGSLAIAADFPDETGRFFMLGTVVWTGLLFRSLRGRFPRSERGETELWIQGSLRLAGGLFALTFLATSGARWVGMTRYLLPIQFLLLPATIATLRDVKPRTWASPRLRYGLLLGVALLYSIQVRFLLRFTSGWWVS